MGKKYTWKIITWFVTLVMFGMIEFVVLYLFGDYQQTRLSLVTTTILAGVMYLFVSLGGLFAVLFLSRKYPDISDESPFTYFAMLALCAIVTNLVWLFAVNMLGVKTDLGLLGSVFLSFFNMGASVGTYLSIDRTMSAVP